MVPAWPRQFVNSPTSWPVYSPSAEQPRAGSLIARHPSPSPEGWQGQRHVSRTVGIAVVCLVRPVGMGCGWRLCFRAAISGVPPVVIPVVAAPATRLLSGQMIWV